jgi:hypothetical protein
VDVTAALEVGSPSFANPHGVAWLDETTVAVANRHGGVGIPTLPGEAGSATPAVISSPRKAVRKEST